MKEIGIIKMTIYLLDNQLEDYILRYSERLEQQGLNDKEIELRLKSHLSTNVVIKYSKKWQDIKYKELLYLITDVPGGYWQVQEYINNPHVEFEHYKHRSRRSYEKGNVSLSMAKKELPENQFEIYKLFNKSKIKKNDNNTELEIDCEVEGKFVDKNQFI